MIEAVISDFGGVLTSPLLDSFAAFQDSSGISLEHLGLAMAAIWKRDGAYYGLTAGVTTIPGGKQVRAEFLHRSSDLEHWTYLHPFLEDDYYGMVGDDGACRRVDAGTELTRSVSREEPS